MKSVSAVSENPFDVPFGIRIFRTVIRVFRPLFILLGRMEPLLMGRLFSRTTLDRPVWITGLARAGSTITLEYLNGIPGTATHKYRDYPAIYTPFIWNAMTTFAPLDETPKERAHRDGIMVNLSSPEAQEELLWMTWFPKCHDTAVSHILDMSTSNHSFETFFREHLRKLVAIRNGSRYVSKANYNISRIGYLLKIAPDAKFVLLIRDPVQQVAAFIKQSKFVADAQRRFPFVLNHFRHAGHFEYGLDFRPVNVSGPHANDDILSLIENGEDVRAWARYWSRVNRWLYDVGHASGTTAACLIVRYEDLCDDGEAWLGRINEHCGFSPEPMFVKSFAEKLHRPTYYKSSLTDEDIAIVWEEVGETAELFGYTNINTNTERTIAL